ncbi:hypothetical protein DSM106972_065240 [Dulcicalothrix desertica PCC 7102]|uniref:Uncharacterized protein n=1 Tax=Dulcicalothrix desertica PCC 7102 TaxID=232991 RepID=A0A3S1IT16_9CYAN|nr:hypothetical protein [Dulcicalothrix desertica]RUT01901.1 hypothetical protein DSM106972_065240 [Dulcicalothrix desertica PCC 7102]TWH43053.1 hypothetical protein CAL7102_06747 [Dulcicalothrix desertica PCC 7102]
MKLKATIVTMVSCLTLAIPSTNQYTFASAPSRLSQVTPSSRVSEIPKSVISQIRQDMAKRLNLKLGDVRVVRVDPKIFDSCLGLPEKNEKCKEIAYTAWAVRVAGGKQSWLYHVVSSKSLRNNFRVNWLESLPQSVRKKAISNATQLSEPPIDTIKIISVEPRVWKNNCLELPKTAQRCNSIQTPGWLIKLKNNKPHPKEPLEWVYRSDLDGKILEFDLIASVGNISQKTIADILLNAAKLSQIERSAWKVDKVQTLQWSSYGGNGRSRPIQGMAPVKDNVFGWKMLVSSPKQQWVYYVTRNWVEFDSPQSVPSYLVEEATKMAAAQTGKPAANYRLHWVQHVTWGDTCLGISINKPACQKTSVPGWSIQVIGPGETDTSMFMIFNFHSRLDRDVRFNGSNPWLPPPVVNPGLR